MGRAEPARGRRGWAGRGRGFRPPRESECSSSVLGHPPRLELPTPGLPPGARPRRCSGNAGACAPVRVHVRGPGLPLGARDSGAALALAFGQVSRAPVSHCALARIPRRGSWTPRAWFTSLRHCLWGAGICRTNGVPSLIWNERGNSSHPGQTAQPQSSGSARPIGALGFPQVLPSLAGMHLTLPWGDLIA